MKTVAYAVTDGVYPFDNVINVIYTFEQDDKEAEAAAALDQAKRICGNTCNPTVEPL